MLCEAHLSVLVLGGTSQHFSTTLGGHFEQKNHQQNHKCVKTPRTLNRRCKGHLLQRSGGGRWRTMKVPCWLILGLPISFSMSQFTNTESVNKEDQAMWTLLVSSPYSGPEGLAQDHSAACLADQLPDLGSSCAVFQETFTHTKVDKIHCIFQHLSFRFHRFQTIAFWGARLF